MGSSSTGMNIKNIWNHHLENLQTNPKGCLFHSFFFGVWQKHRLAAQKASAPWTSPGSFARKLLSKQSVDAANLILPLLSLAQALWMAFLEPVGLHNWAIDSETHCYCKKKGIKHDTSLYSRVLSSGKKNLWKWINTRIFPLIFILFVSSVSLQNDNQATGLQDNILVYLTPPPWPCNATSAFF